MKNRCAQWQHHSKPNLSWGLPFKDGGNLNHFFIGACHRVRINVTWVFLLKRKSTNSSLDRKYFQHNLLTFASAGILQPDKKLNSMKYKCVARKSNRWNFSSKSSRLVSVFRNSSLQATKASTLCMGDGSSLPLIRFAEAFCADERNTWANLSWSGVAFCDNLKASRYIVAHSIREKS